VICPSTPSRFLIGKILVHELRGQRTSGRIMEVEAYAVGDPAGHAFGGKTQRNASLYLARGHAYVYSSMEYIIA
jgi:DNA-3-methyladenine glycosylase